MSDIEPLRENMQEMSEKLDALPSVDEKPKTALEILGRREREDYWKSLLTYFLNPNEPHGVSADLLEEVLNQLPLEISFDSLELEDAKVVSEPQMDVGRADIAVYIEGEWFVLFELKVGSGEGKGQTRKYVNSDKLDDTQKEEFQEGGFYVFVSKDGYSSEADEFVDVSWRRIMEAVNEVLRKSEGEYTAKGTAQLKDFRDSIKDVIEMDDTENQQIWEKKTKLYAEYYDEIENLKNAFENLRDREENRWHRRLVEEFEPDGWSEEWNCYDSRKGRIYRDGWWLDENGKPTDDFEDLHFGIYFQHFIWKPSTFRDGGFLFRTITPDKSPDEYREEVRELFNGDYGDEVAEVMQKMDSDIDYRKTGKRNRTKHYYTFDATEGPDAFYETLSEAVEDHLELAPIITEVHETAVDRVTDGEITF